VTSGSAKRLIVVVKPFKVEAVVRALLACGAESLTYGEARGYGRQKGHLDAYRDDARRVTFLPKVRLECAVPADRVDEAIESVSTAARTGRIGDGKIFISDLE
jgi:nitrogen regulatory protein PII